jgi:chromosome segregation ATPase
MGLIDLQVTKSLADITSRQATVENLMRQLAQAQKDLESAKQNSNNLAIQKQQLVQSISSANSNISTISQNINTCSNQTLNLKQSIQTLQISVTSKQVLINQLNN